MAVKDINAPLEPRKEPKWVARARRLRQQGMMYKDIAKEVGKHQSTIKDWLLPHLGERRRKRVRNWQYENDIYMKLLTAKHNAASGGYAPPKITIAEFEKLRASHDDNCDCCGKHIGVKKLRLDHCHITGLIRGLICTACNAGIGCLGDSVEGVMKAVKYLRKV